MRRSEPTAWPLDGKRTPVNATQTAATDPAPIPAQELALAARAAKVGTAMVPSYAGAEVAPYAELLRQLQHMRRPQPAMAPPEITPSETATLARLRARAKLCMLQNEPKDAWHAVGLQAAAWQQKRGPRRRGTPLAGQPSRHAADTVCSATPSLHGSPLAIPCPFQPNATRAPRGRVCGTKWPHV